MVSYYTIIPSALKWKVHPPTAYCFAKHLLFLLPYDSTSLDARQDVLELARFLCELSVIDYFFVPYRSSAVALATLFNAMELVSGISESCQREFEMELERLHWISPIGKEVMECRDRLRILYAQGGYSGPEGITSRNVDENEMQHEPRDDAISPVSVVQYNSSISRQPK